MSFVSRVRLLSSIKGAARAHPGSRLQKLAALLRQQSGLLRMQSREIQFSGRDFFPLRRNILAVLLDSPHDGIVGLRVLVHALLADIHELPKNVFIFSEASDNFMVLLTVLDLLVKIHQIVEDVEIGEPLLNIGSILAHVVSVPL